MIALLALIVAILLAHALWLDHTLNQLASRIRHLENLIDR